MDKQTNRVFSVDLLIIFLSSENILTPSRMNMEHLRRLCRVSGWEYHSKNYAAM